jgi:hypothetical protein
MPVYFAAAPEIVVRVCAAEAERVWNDRHPLMRKVNKARGTLG